MEAAPPTRFQQKDFEITRLGEPTIRTPLQCVKFFNGERVLLDVFTVSLRTHSYFAMLTPSD